MSVPERLRVESDPRPLGIATGTPRLSWWAPPGAAEQSGYRIRAVLAGGSQALEASVESASSVLEPWPFEPVGSRTAVEWMVQVRTGAGWGGWSAPARFETGLLDASDWVAVPVRHPVDDTRPRGHRGATYFRRRFVVPAGVQEARLYATALGIYEAHLDGVRLGDRELAPGFTAYRSVLEYQTYDVTALCGPGEHELVLTATDGWYRGSIGFIREENVFGEHVGVVAQLELHDASGRRTTIATDATWDCSREGRIVAADLIEGQTIDLRVPPVPVDGWVGVSVHGTGLPSLTASPMPPTRRCETYRPERVVRLDEATQVVTFPANLNGWVEIATRVLGPAGTTVRLTHGELLDELGDVDVRHLQTIDYAAMAADPQTDRPVPDLLQFNSSTPGLLGAGQVDSVVSDGTDVGTVEFRHTTHGFQHVRVEGALDITADDIAAVMVHTDMRRTGWFACSDDRLNSLHDAAVLSFRGNACEIPTDCPQRERAGWTGDWQIFFPTASFLFDVSGFDERWLRDLAFDQWRDGRVPNFVPDSAGPAAVESPVRSFMTGSAGWGDAATIVPWEHWLAYGDGALLERQYPSMVRWAEFCLDRAASGRHPSREANGPEWREHDQYLWDTGFHWGEWCLPGGNPDVFSGQIDMSSVATAYLYRSLQICADTARVLGRTADADRFDGRADAVRRAWRNEFVGADGTVTPHDQYTLVRALAFDLVEERHRDRVAADLVSLVGQADDHLGTGFLATPFLLPVLADSGHLDVAYRVLFQDTVPSWLYMVDQGSSTIWENWEGLDAAGFGSFNHYSKGAVVTFLHRYVAGLRPLAGSPGWRRFEIRPQPGAGLTWAEAIFDSPAGRIRSAWRIVAGEFHVECTVPPGSSADLTLPDGSVHHLAPGDHRHVATVV